LHASLETGDYWFVTRQPGVIEKLVVELRVEDPTDWPRVEESDAPNVRAHIHVPDHYVAPVFEQVARLEGYLSFFGLQKIHSETALFEWMPETDEEQRSLTLTRLQVGRFTRKDEELPIVPFDVLARALVAAQTPHVHEIPLVFYRKAFGAFKEDRYIEAIYDYFFMLESAFGAGKFRKKDLAKAFLASNELTSAIGEILRSPGPAVTGRAETRERFTAKHSGMTTAAYVTSVVDLRGHLHHHSVSRHGVWHPDKQREFELEAAVLADVCFVIASKWRDEQVFSPETAEQAKRGKFRKATAQSGSD